MSKFNDKVEAIFEAALALKTEAQRAAYLSRACLDPELRREVESLLAAHQNPDPIFFEAKTTLVQPPASQGAFVSAGTVVGAYRIIRALGQGGMGAVYEAEEIESGRRLALKVLRQALDSPVARRRFLREGLLAASVNHPNTVYVFGTDEIDGQPVIAMELVSGGTLDDRVQPDKPMAAAEAVDAILQVIAGLEAAAALGVLHRDIKPSNCFVEADGTVKVGDFGLSISSAVGGESKLTMTGSFLGTPAFSSPEQLRGGGFTIQGDIYAVGVTLYYLLTGRTPFQGDDLVRMLATVLERSPDSPAQSRPDLPDGLCRAVLRCLEKQPAKRFRNYAELRSALLPYSSAAPTPATLSLRFLAGFIDWALLAAIYISLPLLSPGHWDALFHPDYPSTKLFSTFTTVLSLLYYAVFEGLWGASIGKRICGLQVTSANRGLPGVPRAFLRAVIFGLPALPPLLFLWFSLHASEATALKWKGLFDACFLPILGLLFCTARRRNGFAAVQDLWTRTRVTRKTAHGARPGLAAAQDRPAAAGAGPQLGPYHVVETLGRSGAEETLLGFDPRLLRKVWIRKLPTGTPPVAPALRNLARVGRLRWLNGRRSSEECWDVYEAVPGKSLAELISRRQPWSQVRFWLLDLAEEVTAAAKDQSLPAILELDRVWITADGRAKLLDFPAPGDAAHRDQAELAAAAEASGAVASPQLFLSQVAVAALEGRPVAAAEARPGSAAIPLPLHARDLLSELQAGLNPSLLAERLKPLLNELAFVSLRRRLGVIAGSAAVPLAAATLVTAFFLFQLGWPWTSTSEVAVLSQCLERLAAPMPMSGLSGVGDAYSANLLGPDRTWNGTPFHFGPTNAADVVSAAGQTIALPPGRFSSLAMLGTAVWGNQTSQVLTVTYDDHTSSKWTQSFSDWWFDPQQYPGEANALTMPYCDRSNGTQADHRVHLYAYRFPLDRNRVARSFTLPANTNLEVLALTLEPPATTVDLSAVFNRANGIVADGSASGEKSREREALEVYIAGRFRQAITNPATWTSLTGALIPPDQRTAAEHLIAAPLAFTDMEFRQAAGIVEPRLKSEGAGGRAMELADFVTSLVEVIPWTLLAASALPSLVAALLFRGGLVLRMLGLAIVKEDGTKASRLRIFWRSLIAWCPAVLLFTFMARLLVPLFDRGALSGESAVGTILVLILAIGLVVWAALLPERGLHDRVAGTCLVPRE